jgi:UDP-N-acetylglucosamine 2-epimerase
MLRELEGADRLAFSRSVPRDDYLALLAGAAAIVGNSSSGIIEAPMLAVPAVNVGQRQLGRTRGDNVVDVSAEAGAVAAAVAAAADTKWRSTLSGRSPYGDGHAAGRIVDAIVEQAIDARLLVKEVAT